MPAHDLPAIASSSFRRTCATTACLLSMVAVVTAAPPGRYEISINGENFTLESDRIVKLNSSDRPGTTYEVAIRVAQYQPWQLKSAKFDYHNGFTPSEDPAAIGRSVSFKHDLGFVMVVNDLGGHLPEANRDKTLQILVDSMQRTLAASRAAQIEIGKPAVRTIGDIAVRGVTIRYLDRDDVGRSSLVYLVTGPTLSCSVVVQCLDADRDNVMPLVKATIDSFKGI